MTEPDPAFDAVHPSAAVMFRSCRGGYLHSVGFTEAAGDAPAHVLALAILLTAQVSHLKAVMQVREEIIAAGFTPSGELPAPGDLDAAQSALMRHRLR